MADTRRQSQWGPLAKTKSPPKPEDLTKKSVGDDEAIRRDSWQLQGNIRHYKSENAGPGMPVVPEGNSTNPAVDPTSRSASVGEGFQEAPSDWGDTVIIYLIQSDY